MDVVLPGICEIMVEDQGHPIPRARRWVAMRARERRELEILQGHLTLGFGICFDFFSCILVLVFGWEAALLLAGQELWRSQGNQYLGRQDVLVASERLNEERRKSTSQKETSKQRELSNLKNEDELQKYPPKKSSKTKQCMMIHVSRSS